MALFESRGSRVQRRKGELRRAVRTLDRKIDELGDKVKKNRADAVAYAKSGEKHRTTACVRRIYTLYRLKRGAERRRDLLEGWAIQVDAASTDEEIARVLIGLARLLKVPPTRLPQAIEKFTGELEFQQTDSEDAWKDAEAQEERQGQRAMDEAIPTEDEIMKEIMAQAGVERETEARKPSLKEADLDETAELRARANRVTEDTDK
jgi:hypothetical protein